MARDRGRDTGHPRFLPTRFVDSVSRTPGVDGHPEVMAIHADRNSVRATGEQWHSDVSCDARPPMGSILRMHTVPDTGGDTLFANMYAAYDALSERMQALLDGLQAVHDGGPYYREVNHLIGRGGRAILGFLFEHVARPDFQCRFRWRPNSVAMWDNRCTQHHAIWDYWPATRSGY